MPNTTLQHWLWQVAKTDKANAEVVPMGIDATQQAILAGAVDGASIREPALTIVQGRNPGVKLIANGAEMFPDQPGTVVGVYGAYADRNPGAVESLVRSLIRADTLLKSDSAKAAPHVLAALGKGIVDLATIQKALTSPRRSSPSIRAPSSSPPRRCRPIRSPSAPWRRTCPSMGCSTRATTRRRSRADRMKALRAPALAALGLVAFLLFWEAMPRLELINPAFLPPPSTIPAAFLTRSVSGSGARRCCRA